MTISSGIHFFLAGSATFILLLFTLFAQQKDSDYFFKFDDEVDHLDIHRLQQMKHQVDFYTGNCSADSYHRDTDGDGVNDCKDEFPLWTRASERKDGHPHCDCTQNGNSTHPDYDCGKHKTNIVDKNMCEQTTWPSSNQIGLDDDGIITFKYYFQDMDTVTAEKRTRYAECVSAYESAQAAGYSCKGRVPNMWNPNSDGQFSPEALHCTELVCCAMTNLQKADSSSSLVSDDYNTAAKCNNWNFHRLYEENRTEFDPDTDFRAQTTVSLTHFCSYVSSPANPDISNDQRECISIHDALTLYGRQSDKNLGTMNVIYNHDSKDISQSFSTWWYAQWILFGLSVVHVALAFAGHVMDGQNSYSCDLGTYFAGDKADGWKNFFKTVFALIVFCVFAVSLTVLVTFLTFMTSTDFHKNQPIAMHTSSNTTFTIGNTIGNIKENPEENAYPPFEFFDTSQTDVCPPEIKETDCQILGNVQHHVYKHPGDRWQTWSYLILIAYIFQTVAALLFFSSLVFKYNDWDDKSFFSARIGSGAPGSSSASKVGSSTSTPPTGTQTQKKVVSAYASGKIKNGSMRF